MKAFQGISESIWAQLPQADDTFFLAIGKRAVNFYNISVLVVLIEVAVYFGFVILWQTIPTGLYNIPSGLDAVAVQSCTVDLRCETNSLWNLHKFVREEEFDDGSRQLTIDAHGRSDCQVSLCLPDPHEQDGKPLVFDIAGSLLDIDFSTASAPKPYGRWDGSALAAAYPLTVISEVGRASKVWIRSPPVPAKVAAEQNYFNVTVSSGVVMLSAAASAFGEYHTRVGFGSVLVVPAADASAGLSASIDVLGSAYCVQDAAATLTVTEIENASRPVPSWNWIPQSVATDSGLQTRMDELTPSDWENINNNDKNSKTNNNNNSSSIDNNDKQQWYNETEVNVTVGNGGGAKISGFASSFYVVDPSAARTSRIVGETINTRRPQIDLASVEALRGSAAWAEGSPLPDFAQVVEIVSPGLGSIFLNSNRRVLLEFSPALLALLTGFSLVPQYRRLLTPLSHYRCNATFADLFPDDALLLNLENSDQRSVAELQRLTADFLPNDVLLAVWSEINAAAGGFTGFRTPAIVRSRHPEALDTFEMEDSHATRVQVTQRPIDRLLLGLTALVAIIVVLGLVAVLIASRRDIVEALLMRRDRERTREAFEIPKESPYILYLSTLYVHQLAAFLLCRQLEPYLRRGSHLRTFLRRFFVEDKSAYTEYAASDVIESFEDDCRARFLVVSDPDSRDLDECASSVEASTDDRIVEAAVGVAPAAKSVGGGEVIGGGQFLVTGKSTDTTLLNTVALRCGIPVDDVYEEVETLGVKLLRQTHFMLMGAELKSDGGEPFLSADKLCEVYATLDSLIWSAPLFGLCLYPMCHGTKKEMLLPALWIAFQLILCSILFRLPAVFILFVVTMFESTNLQYTPSTDVIHVDAFGSVVFPGRRGVMPFSFFVWNLFAILFAAFVGFTWIESVTVLGFRRWSAIATLRAEVVRAIISAVAAALTIFFVASAVGYIVIVMLWWVLGAIIAPTAMLANATAAIAAVAAIAGAYSTLQNNRKALVSKLKAKALEEISELFKSASGTIGASDEDDSLGDALGPGFSAGNLIEAASGDIEAIAKLAPVLGVPPLCITAVVAGSKKDLPALKIVTRDALDLVGAGQLRIEALIVLVLQKLLEVPVAATDIVRALSEFLSQLPINEDIKRLLTRSESLIANLIDAVILHEGDMDVRVLFGAVTRLLIEVVQPLVSPYGISAESVEGLRRFGNACSQRDFPAASGALWSSVQHLDLDTVSARTLGNSDDARRTTSLLNAVRRMAEVQLAPKPSVDVRTAAIELLSCLQPFLLKFIGGKDSKVDKILNSLMSAMENTELLEDGQNSVETFEGLGVTLQLLFSVANSKASEWNTVAAVFRFAFVDAKAVKRHEGLELLRPLVTQGVVDVKQATRVRLETVFDIAIDLFDDTGRRKYYEKRDAKKPDAKKRDATARDSDDAVRNTAEDELAHVVAYVWLLYSQLLGVFDGSHKLVGAKADIVSGAKGMVDRSNMRTGLNAVELLSRLADVLRKSSGKNVADPLRIAQGPLLLALAGSWDPVRALLPLDILVPPQVLNDEDLPTPAYRAIESHLKADESSVVSFVTAVVGSGTVDRALALRELCAAAREALECNGEPRAFVDSYKYQLLCPFAIAPPSMYDGIFDDDRKYPDACYIGAVTLPLVRRILTQRLTPYKAWYRARVNASIVSIQKAALLPEEASATAELLIEVLSEIWTVGQQHDRAALVHRAKDVSMSPAQLAVLLDPASLVAASPVAEVIVASAMYVPQTGEAVLRRLRSRREYREAASDSFKTWVDDFETRVKHDRNTDQAQPRGGNPLEQLVKQKTHMAPQVYRLARALVVISLADEICCAATTAAPSQDGKGSGDSLSASDVSDACASLARHLADLKIPTTLLDASVSWIRTAFGKRVSHLSCDWSKKKTDEEQKKDANDEHIVELDRLVCRAALQADWHALSRLGVHLSKELETASTKTKYSGEMGRVVDFFTSASKEIAEGCHMHNPSPHFANPLATLGEVFDDPHVERQPAVEPAPQKVTVTTMPAPIDEVQETLLGGPNGTGEYQEMSAMPTPTATPAAGSDEGTRPDLVTAGLIATLLRSNFGGAQAHLVAGIDRVLSPHSTSHSDEVTALSELLLGLCRAIMQQSTRPGPEDVISNAIGIAEAVVSLTFCNSDTKDMKDVGTYAKDLLSISRRLVRQQWPSTEEVRGLLDSSLPAGDVSKLLTDIVTEIVKTLSGVDGASKEEEPFINVAQMCVAYSCKKASVNPKLVESVCTLSRKTMLRVRGEADAKAKLGVALRLFVDECVVSLATLHDAPKEAHGDAAHNGVLPGDTAAVMRKLAPIVLFLAGDFTYLPPFLDACGITLDPQAGQAAVAALVTLKTFASDKPMTSAALMEGAKQQFVDAFVDFIFNEFDREGQGSIDFNSLTAILRRLHLQISTSQQKALFARADKDKSGVIDKREFRAVLDEVQEGFVDQALELLNLSQGRIMAAVAYLGCFTVAFLAFILIGTYAFTDGSEFTTVITGGLPVLTRGLKGLASPSSLEQLVQLGEKAIALVFEHVRSRGM